MNKIQKACEWLAEKHGAEFASAYGEPGYSDPEKGIILANWNAIPKGLADWLERCGYSLEWADEWIVDHNHGGKAYRTQPDSYGWESSIMLTTDGEWLTPDDSPSDWIDECANDRMRPDLGCLPSRITDSDLHDAGFKLFRGDLESGWHPGQTDDPQAIAKLAFDAGAYRVVFRKVENSQFYVRFECWVEMDETEESEK